MSMSVSQTFELENMYVQLHDGPAAAPVSVDPGFWDLIEQRKELHRGRLVVVTHQNGPSDHWEMHPAGDELLYLLSGQIDVVLEEKGAEQAVKLAARRAVIVPQGVWHTIKVHAPSDLLAITRGAGTQIRPIGNNP